MPEIEPYSFPQAVDLIRDAIERSRTRHERWRVYEALYRTGSIDQAMAAVSKTGSLWDPYDLPLDQHVVNLALPHINLTVSTVTARDPKHIATPLSGGPPAELTAKLAEQAVDYFWMRANATQDLQDATWDMVRVGNGFLKTGWETESREEDLSERELEALFADLLEADEDEAELEGRELTPEDELAAAMPTTQTVYDRDEPTVEYASPYDIFVPPNARRMRETRWVAHRITLPADEILANEEYDVDEDSLILDGDGLEDETVAEWRRAAAEEKTFEGGGRPEALETATIFEFYDMRSYRLMVLQIDGDKPLYDEELYYSHENPPFVHLRNYSPNGNEFWAFGDLENIAHLQAMFNEMWTEQLEKARRAGTKWVADNEILGQLEELMESDEGDVVAGIDTDGRDLKEVIYAVQQKALSSDVYQSRADLEEFIQTTLGISDLQRGVAEPRVSATAAAVVDGVDSLRAQDKIQTVEEAAAEAATHILLLCQEMLDVPRMIRIVGDEGAAWPEVSREDIEGEFLMKIEGGSTKAVNPATLEQRGQRTLTEIVPMLVELGYDPTPAVRQALRDMGYDPDRMLGERLPPPPEEAPAPGGGGEQPVPADVTAAGGPPTSAQAQMAGDVAI